MKTRNPYLQVDARVFSELWYKPNEENPGELSVTNLGRKFRQYWLGFGSLGSVSSELWYKQDEEIPGE